MLERITITIKLKRGNADDAHVITLAMYAVINRDNEPKGYTGSFIPWKRQISSHLGVNRSRAV